MEGIQNLLFFKANTGLGSVPTQLHTELWDGPPEDGPQLLDAERGRLFALAGVWDDGVKACT